MIYINQNSTNTAVLSLQERSLIYRSGNTPYYLFEFKFEQDNYATTKRFCPIYVTGSSRYDEVQIIESSTENLTGGTVQLNSGFWLYNVYEQTSQYNTSLAGTLNQTPIEKGKVLVSGSTSHWG